MISRILCIKCIVLLVSVVKVTTTQNVNLTIPLNKSLTQLNREIFGDFLILNHSSTLRIDFENVNPNISFIILQVHSFMYNVTLYNNTCSHTSCVTGKNIGLYSPVKPSPDTLFVYNPNGYHNLRIYISVHAYGNRAPIAGGCNMEFPIPITPFLQIAYNSDYIFVDAAPSRDPKDKKCNFVGNITMEFYAIHLPHKVFISEDIYFDGIRKMLTLDNIQEYGELIPETSPTWKVRRMLAAYPGKGSVHVAVARYDSGAPEYSVYVPALTYACSPLIDDKCELFADDVVSKMLCAMLLFIGFFLCYFGHSFFKTEMFVFGMFDGIILTYIIISTYSSLDRPALLGASVLSGLFFGAIWLIFWWFYGIPFFSVMLPTFTLGFLVAAIIYYVLPGDVYILQPNMAFWIIITCTVLLVGFTLLSVTYVANILCCAVVGAYAIVYVIDFYIRSNLKYIVINIIRRATVPRFNEAVIFPPFGYGEILIINLWIFFAVTGFLYQHYRNRARPPFPPPPRSSIALIAPGTAYDATHIRRRRQPFRNNASTSTADANPLKDSERTPLICR